MGYLISQIFLCLLAAFLLGLLLGWLLWSRRRETETVVTDDRALATARTRIQALEADLADCRAASASAAAPVAAASASGAATGLFGAPAEKPIDDLKRISGIGPKIERQLAGIGVTTFRQIANFTSDDVERVNDAIQVFQGRIEREDWIAQARDLHREDYGDEA